jgi:hypothetical protein
MKALGWLLGVAAVTVGGLWLVMDKILEDDKRTEVREGDLVQWESGGVYVFDIPKKIQKIVDSEFGRFAYFENSKAAIPVGELRRVL